MLGLILGLRGNQLAHFFHDDAFFYIKTAQNLADGYGSTFDRLSRTNGYHPLWLLILCAAATLKPLIGFGGLRWVMFLHAILVVGACHQLAGFVRQLGGSPTVQGAATAATLAVSGASDIGLESALLLLVAWTYLSLLAKALLSRRMSAGTAAGIAIFAALVALARTDAVLLIETVSLLVWFENRRRRRTSLLAGALPAFAALVAFFAFRSFNQVYFGHPDTISSHLKIGWPGTFATGWFLGSLLGIKVRMICCAFVAILAVAHSATAIQRQHRGLRIGIGLFILGYLAILVLFARGGIASWYFALPLSLSFVSLSLVASERLARASHRFHRFCPIVVFILWVFSSCVYLAPRLWATHRLPQVRLGQWLKANTAEDRAIFQIDGTGFVAYFSERDVIDGDGLANSWDYQAVLRSGRLLSYLQATKTTWVVSHTPPDSAGVISIDVPVDWVSTYRLARIPASSAVFADIPYRVFPLSGLLAGATTDRAPESRASFREGQPSQIDPKLGPDNPVVPPTKSRPGLARPHDSSSGVKSPGW